MTSIVGVQYDVAVAGQIVMFTWHALAREVRVGIDVAVIEHQDWKRSLAVRDVHHARDLEAITPVGDQVALVRAVVAEQPTEPEVAAVVLIDQRLYRDRMRLGSLGHL